MYETLCYFAVDNYSEQPIDVIKELYPNCIDNEDNTVTIDNEIYNYDSLTISKMLDQISVYELYI